MKSGTLIAAAAALTVLAAPIAAEAGNASKYRGTHLGGSSHTVGTTIFGTPLSARDIKYRRAKGFSQLGTPRSAFDFVLKRDQVIRNRKFN